ncbi:hypothetical protein QOM21_02570 [Streptomyces sp. Pv4-95]|uniref:hypothetical protein n=1 Tax=Streptomyces sp. Pv4-95 TaxID=3049543 RepID=UPI00389194A4
MEFESVAEELYTLHPAEFTAARDAYAARAREAGDRGLTARIRHLRRPSRAAWAANLLVHRQPDEVHGLLDLGKQLREAHQTLDTEQLRQLGRQQHLVTASMARQAQELAREAGQSISDSVLWEVEATLHAAVADADAASRLATGRLTKALTHRPTSPRPPRSAGSPALHHHPPEPPLTRPKTPPGALGAERWRQRAQRRTRASPPRRHAVPICARPKRPSEPRKPNATSARSRWPP